MWPRKADLLGVPLQGVHVRMLYQYHSTEPVALPAHIQHFSASDLSGHGQAERNPRPILGQHEIVWDYERTLARRVPINHDQDRPHDSIEECKELFEQVPVSGQSIRRRKLIRRWETLCTDFCITLKETSCSPETLPNNQAGPIYPDGQHSRNPPDLQMPTTGSALPGAEEPSDPYETYLRHPASHTIPGPPSPFNDMNMYDVSEHDQMLFLQAMNDMQAQNGTGELDAFEDWLRG